MNSQRHLRQTMQSGPLCVRVHQRQQSACVNYGGGVRTQEHLALGCASQPLDTQLVVLESVPAMSS